jgi:hypothetical protein
MASSRSRDEKGDGRSRSLKIKYRKGSSGLPLQGTAPGKRAEEALRFLDTRTECKIHTHTKVKSSISDSHLLLWLSITNGLAFYLKISESDVEKMMESGFTNNSNCQINVNPAEY